MGSGEVVRTSGGIHLGQGDTEVEWAGPTLSEHVL
jgi:hypothetical protein